MIKRYTRMQPMGQIWSDQRKFGNWVRLEAESLRAQVQLGMLLGVQVPDDLESSIHIDPDAIEELELGTPDKPGTGHDVVAFLLHTNPQLPEEIRPHWHRKMTSMDPGETSLSMQIVDSMDVIMHDVAELMEVLKARAFEFKKTPMIGRTHGVHAEPVTFGVKLALWHDEFARHQMRLSETFQRIAVGKLSGAVGMFTLSPKVEEIVCQRLGLKPIMANQVIPRDLIAEYLSVLALIASSVEKFATTLRGLQRTEIREVQEPFRKGQKGSSAMPHKRNPVGLEACCGLARVVQSNAQVGLRDQVNWDERDISNSSPERVVVPDSSILTDYILNRFTRILKDMNVFPERMLLNLNMTRGLVFSQDVQALVAAKSGLPREEAYALVYDVAQACWENGSDFMEALAANEQIRSKISEADLQSCFDLEWKLQYVDHIFDTVFGLAD